MPLVQNIRIHPIPEKGPDALALIQERVSNYPSGRRGNLTEVVYGEVPTFNVSLVADNIEDLEKGRDMTRSDPSFADYVAKLSSMLRKPTVASISEPVVSAVAPASTVKFIHTARINVPDARVAEVGSILEEFIKGLQEAGRGTAGLSASHFSGMGRIYTMRDTYESLTEYQNSTRQNSELVLGLFSKLDGKTVNPGLISELRQVITRFGQ